MQPPIQFQVHNHYNESHSGLVFTRALMQVPGNRDQFYRLWTLHILHAHPEPENTMSCCHGSIGSIAKVQDCISTYRGIGVMGLDGTEVYHQVKLFNTIKSQHEEACSHDFRFVVDHFPATVEETERIRKAAEGALTSTIELETMGYKKLVYS